eukprot:NODE_1061_length_1023_cov_589.336756_g881_i0.p1 GENE.NODE_1061_length_1023_cov_589.336756_g881_i0~~NODE_1061_length_1023_cov_589.336756_g881_i0.p1  ORF type:complete len:253 (-),score=21.13 NODE_1061_length_1023_cov_589.336756_g881_i0:194-952(-)
MSEDFGSLKSVFIPAMVLIVFSAVLGLAALLYQHWYTVDFTASHLSFEYGIWACTFSYVSTYNLTIPALKVLEDTPLSEFGLCSLPGVGNNRPLFSLCYGIFRSTIILLVLGITCCIICVVLGLTALTSFLRDGRTGVSRMKASGFFAMFAALMFLCAIVAFGGFTKLSNEKTACWDPDNCPTGADCSLKVSWYLALVAFLVALYPTAACFLVGFAYAEDEADKTKAKGPREVPGKSLSQNQVAPSDKQTRQ